MFGAGGRGLRKPARSHLTPALDVGGRPADCGTLAEGSEQAGRRKDGSQLGLRGPWGPVPPWRAGGREPPSQPVPLGAPPGRPPTAALCLVQPPIPKPLPCGARPAAAGSPRGSPRGRQEEGRETASSVPSRCAFALCCLRCGAGRLALRPLGVSGRKSDGRARGPRGTGAHTRTLFTLRFLAARGGAPGGEPVSLCGAV